MPAVGLLGKRFSNRQRLLRAGAHSPARQHQPRGHAFGCPGRETARLRHDSRRRDASSPPPAHPARAGRARSRWSPVATPPAPPRRPRCRTEPGSAAHRARPRRSPGPVRGVPPVTILASNSNRGPTSASARGRPSRLSSTRSAAASMCSRASACSGARCHTADQVGLAAFERLRDAQRSGENRVVHHRDVELVVELATAAVEHRRGPRRPQRGLGGGHRPAPQVGAVAVRPAERLTRLVAGGGDTGQLHQRSQRVRSFGAAPPHRFVTARDRSRGWRDYLHSLDRRRRRSRAVRIASPSARDRGQ